MKERWDGAAPAPPSYLRTPDDTAVVGARDEADLLLTPPGSPGPLDRYVDRVEAAAHGQPAAVPTGQLLLVAGRHAVVTHGVSACSPSVTDDNLAAGAVGESAGAAAAQAAELSMCVVDAGTASGDLVHTDAMPADQVRELLARGRRLGESAGRRHSVLALDAVGIGNTRVPSALTAVLLDVAPAEVVSLDAGADTAMVPRRTEVVAAAPARVRSSLDGKPLSTKGALACVGGPEFRVLAGAVLGAASVNAVTVLDGLATSVAALIAVRIEPGAAAYLIAGRRSRKRGHDLVLDHLGLEPLLDLRLGAGEGVGAVVAAGMLISGLKLRREIGRTAP